MHCLSSISIASQNFSAQSLKSAVLTRQCTNHFMARASFSRVYTFKRIANCCTEMHHAVAGNGDIDPVIEHLLQNARRKAVKSEFLNTPPEEYTTTHKQFCIFVAPLPPYQMFGYRRCSCVLSLISVTNDQPEANADFFSMPARGSRA